MMQFLPWIVACSGYNSFQLLSSAITRLVILHWFRVVVSCGATGKKKNYLHLVGNWGRLKVALDAGGVECKHAFITRKNVTRRGW